jgi:hypothetical protein
MAPSAPLPVADVSAPVADASATAAAIRSIEQCIVTLTLEAQEDLFDEEDLIAPSDMLVSLEELDPGTILDLDKHILVGKMIDNDDEDDTSYIEFDKDNLQLQVTWEFPVSFMAYLSIEHH